MAMDVKRKLWNSRQKELRHLLEVGDKQEAAINLFLTQHAMVHTAEISDFSLPSFEDEILAGTMEETIRRIPRNSEHSIAWCLWHIARIEDVTMNLLVAGSAQLYDLDEWHERLEVDVLHTGNAMDVPAVEALSSEVDIEALREYRVAVGLRTRQIVQQLQPWELKSKVDPTRLVEVMQQGAVVEEARGIVDYWGRRTIAGLLLLPATRHSFIHLNEAMQLKKRRA